MLSRAFPVVETEHVPDEARFYERICEPIAMQLRRMGEASMKIVWRFVAAVNEGEPVSQHEIDKFGSGFHSYDEALEKLTFKDDRELVKKAIKLTSSTFGAQ